MTVCLIRLAHFFSLAHQGLKFWTELAQAQRAEKQQQ